MTEPVFTDPAAPAPAPADAAAPAAASQSSVASGPAWERSVIEKWMQDSLAEQRAARRWKYGMRLAWLLFFATLIWLGMDRSVGMHNTDVSRTALFKA